MSINSKLCMIIIGSDWWSVTENCYSDHEKWFRFDALPVISYYVILDHCTQTSCSKHCIRWEKGSERRKHCALAVLKPSQNFFAPPQTLFQGVQDGQNLINWRWSLPLPINQVWWGSMHATDRTDYNTLCHS